MNIVIRAIIALVGLCLTGAYWIVVYPIVMDNRIYECGAACPTDFEMYMRFLGLLSMATFIYGLGVHFWRTLDDWLRK